MDSGQVFIERSANSENGLDTRGNGGNFIVGIEIAEELLIRMSSDVAQKFGNYSKLMATLKFFYYVN